MALICLNLAVAATLAVRRYEDRPLHWLWSARDDHGHAIGQLPPDGALIAVIDPQLSGDRASIRATCLYVKQLGTPVFLLTDDPRRLREEIAGVDGQARVVKFDLATARRQLGMVGPANQWLLLDNAGMTVARGDFVLKGYTLAVGPARYLSRHAMEAAIDSAISSADDQGAFRMEHENARSSHGGHNIALFLNYVCTGCTLAQTIARFNRACTSRRPVSVTVVFDSRWTAADVRRLTGNLGLKCRTTRASPGFESQWADLTGRYGYLGTNSFAVDFTGNGVAQVAFDTPAVVSLVNW